MSICGLDFGTSNTTLGTIEPGAGSGGAGGRTDTIPSAMFYETDGGVLIGRRAVKPTLKARPAA
jgi:hypothetical chaperone protein